MNRLLLAAAVLAASVAPGAAATIINTDFSANANGLTSSPGDDLAIATSIDVANWVASSVPIPLGGLVPGDTITMTNPILTALGSSITVSWDSGAFSDTVRTTNVSFVGDTLDIVGSGVLTGPGVPTNNSGVLDLAFTQAGGTGEAISGSGTFVDTTGTTAVVPEASTWAMLFVGFMGLGGLASWRRSTGLRLTPLV
jgi:hypothetical protein